MYRMAENIEKPEHRLIRLVDWGKYHPWPPMAGLRHLVFNAKEKKFEKCVKRVGRTVLIDEQAFFEWVEARNDEFNDGAKSTS